MVAVPALTPVTTPLAFTVAIEVFEDDHVPPLTVELKVVVEFKHIVCVPLSVPALVPAVTLRTKDTLGQPTP